MQALNSSYTFWVLLLLLLPCLYLLPTLIGLLRGVDGLMLIFLINLIGAPTGIGWIAALILSFGPRRIPVAQSAPWPARKPLSHRFPR